MNPRLRTAIILLALFTAAWLPRVMALDAFVTIDERKWLARSANFYQAISQGDLANTFQREHPGVTVMWAGTLGFLSQYPEYAAEAPGQVTWDREVLEPWLLENTSHTPLALLAAGRWWVTLAIALAITAMFLPLRLLLGQRFAFFGTLYLAWTPFFVALSRQLHLDGLVAAFSLLALLTFSAWLYGDRQGDHPRRYLIASGFAMGLAWLTKTPAILLVPTGLLLILAEWRRRRSHADGQSLSQMAVGYVVWGLVASAVFVLGWPAMWVDPLGAFGRMAAEMTAYVESHVNPNYFMGQPTDDPGVLFYPVAWLFRTTPLTLIGLIAAAVTAWRKRSPFDQLNARRLSLALLLYALIFTVTLTLTAKKFDRYLLPAFVALDLVAVLGWVGLADWVQERWTRRRGQNAAATSMVATGVLSVAVLLHGLLGFAHFPYYFTYYNPLTGGSRTAPQVLFVGWGEGMDQAADWLNRQPDVENQRTVAWYHDGPLSYFYQGQAAGVGSGSPLLWLDTDYTVVYVNQWQRDIPSPEAIAYFDGLEPVHVVSSHGLELARIYDMHNTSLPDFIDIGKESAADFGERMRLAAYDLSQTIVEPGDEIEATFYLQAIANMDENYNVLVRLVGPDGSELWREEGWPWGAATADWPLREIRPDGHTIAVPSDAEPGLYKLVLSFYDPTTLDALPVTAIGSDDLLNQSERDVALIQVGASADQAGEATSWQFGDNFALDASVPAQAEAGQPLSVDLRWRSLSPTSSRLHGLRPRHRSGRRNRRPTGSPAAARLRAHTHLAAGPADRRHIRHSSARRTDGRASMRCVSVCIRRMGGVWWWRRTASLRGITLSSTGLRFNSRVRSDGYLRLPEDQQTALHSPGVSMLSMVALCPSQHTKER